MTVKALYAKDVCQVLRAYDVSKLRCLASRRRVAAPHIASDTAVVWCFTMVWSASKYYEMVAKLAMRGAATAAATLYVLTVRMVYLVLRWRSPNKD